MSGILTAPKFVKSLPASQRPALGARTSEIQTVVNAFRDKLIDHRDEMAHAVADVVSTSSWYEAFRRAGCEVRVVHKVHPETHEPITERRKDRSGVEKDYPVCDIYVLLPAGEIVNRSKRTPWVAPKVRLAQLRDALQDKKLEAGEREALEAQVKLLLERNPKLS